MNHSFSGFARSVVTGHRPTHSSQPGAAVASAVSRALLMARCCALVVCLCLLAPSAGAQNSYAFQFAVGGTVNQPVGLATDAADNLYVADTNNNRIVKYDSALSFLGKIGSTGTTNGQFSNPTAVAVDSSGNLYVADSSNNRIQKFNSLGTSVWTSGSYGTGNGQFQHPTGVAVDAVGNVYVADTNNNRVQELNSQGTYLSQFGTKGSGNSNFLNPSSVAVDTINGTVYVYVLDTGNGALKQFTSAGTWIWTVGGFSSPQGLTVDVTTHYVYVADSGNRHVMQYDNNGNPIRQIGSAGDGNGEFAYPYGVAVDSLGDIFVTDIGYNPNGYNDYHNRIEEFDSEGNYLNQFGTLGNPFNYPLGVGVDSDGNISVADANDSRVVQFGSQGNYVNNFGGFGDGGGQFINPYGVAVDTTGDIFVTDLGNNPHGYNDYHSRVQKYDAHGNFLFNFGSYGSGNGYFANPTGIALDSSGDIYVCDQGNNRIQIFDSFGNYITQFGSKGTGKGEFQNPTGVAVDRAGNIYVTDSSNYRIQKFNKKYAWVWSVGALGTGNAQFQNPTGIAVDAAGNVYVCDTGNNRVEKFNSVGTFLTQFSADAWGDPYSSAVWGITVDAKGKVYLTEDTNSRLVVLMPVTAAPTLTALTPNQVTVDSGPVTLIATGTNFVSGSTVMFGITPLDTTFVSTTQLTAVVPTTLLTMAGTNNVTVTNPANGGTSKVLTFTIVNPAPTLASLSPNQAAVGSPDTMITLTGTGFVSTSVVHFGSAPLKTTYLSSTQLTAIIPASRMTLAYGYSITVANSSPGGGTSNALTFTVGSNPLPVVSSLSPNQANAGSPDLLLTVTGSNFINGATIKFAGTSLTTALISSTQVTAVVPASLLATAGRFAVTVDNPKPGGGNSDSVTFTVVNPTPVLTGITPNQAPVGAGNTPITLIGSGFTAASTVQFNETILTTTFVSATQLTAVIPASQLTTPGDNNVSVSNAGPGGGTSATVTFSVVSPTPTLTGLSPNHAAVKSAAITLTLTGTNFVNGSVVSFGGTPLTTTFVSTTQLTAVIPASLLTTAGSFDVVVTNPSPGGGDSNPLTFTVK